MTLITIIDRKTGEITRTLHQDPAEIDYRPLAKALASSFIAWRDQNASKIKTGTKEVAG